MSECQDVRMSGCQDVKMSWCHDVMMSWCLMSWCQDFKMSECQNVKMARWQDGKMASPFGQLGLSPLSSRCMLACSATPRYLTAYFAGHCTHPNLFNSPNPLLGGHHHSQHGTFFQCHVTARWRAPGLSLIGELHVLEERSTFLLTIVSLGAFEEAPFTFPFLRILNICNTLDLNIVS